MKESCILFLPLDIQVEVVRYPRIFEAYVKVCNPAVKMEMEFPECWGVTNEVSPKRGDGRGWHC